jgi:ribosome-associated protein
MTLKAKKTAAKTMAPKKTVKHKSAKTIKHGTVKHEAEVHEAVTPEAVNNAANTAAELPESVLLAVRSLNDKKGENITVLDVSSSTPMWDYFIVCSGTSSVHAGALRDTLKKDMAEAGNIIAHEDRDRELKWLVVDFGDMLVHIFEKETRGYYNLESIWSGHEVDVSTLVKE